MGLVNPISRCLSHVKGPASDKKGNQQTGERSFILTAHPTERLLIGCEAGVAATCPPGQDESCWIYRVEHL